MVPHVAARGSSFKGAGLYYLHDKSAQTAHRVDWTLTRNVPTNDPEKALKWMAYTAMTAEQIKEAHGGSRVGRKAKGRPVYSYSLSWHKGDQPSREEMQKAVFETLERLELKDHEAVIVAHRDTDHPHVHVICNLVNPKTGRTHTARMDRITLSEWAQEHDKRFGREHCPERIRNNLERNTGKLRQEFTRQKGQEHTQEETRKKSFVKHRAKEDPRAAIIQDLYNRSDSGKALRAALKEQGYDLAQGHKGRVALVNEQGQVFSLARQLKGQRARDIKARLKDIDFKALPRANELAEERQYFDRDKYAAQQQDKIEAAAIEAEKKRLAVEKKKQQARDPRTAKPKVQENFKEAGKEPAYDDSHLIRLDREMAFSKYEQRKRRDFDERMTELYGREKMAKQLEWLNEKIENKEGLWDKLRGKKKELEERRENLKKELAHVDQVIAGYRATLEREIAEKKARDFKDLVKEKGYDQQPEDKARRQDRLKHHRSAMEKQKPGDREREPKTPKDRKGPSRNTGIEPGL